MLGREREMRRIAGRRRCRKSLQDAIDERLVQQEMISVILVKQAAGAVGDCGLIHWVVHGARNAVILKVAPALEPLAVGEDGALGRACGGEQDDASETSRHLPYLPERER